jgi:hypothetical protein
MKRTWRAALLSAATLAISCSLGRSTKACATCGCGDPTLTSLGTEKPFAGRLRGALQISHRTDAIGQARVNRIELSEQRFDASIAWAPLDFWFVGVTVPAVRRRVTYVNQEQHTRFGLGDIELRNKFFVYQDRAFSPRHLGAIEAGLKLPTAPLARDAQGDLLPLEVQTGTGSFDPILGASYALFLLPWSSYSSVTGSYPTQGVEGSRASPSLRSTLAAQYQPVDLLALRLGVDTRLDGKAKQQGEPEPDSGGFILYLAPAVLLSPVTDLVLTLTVQVPVLNALDGYHDEGAIYSLSTTLDL